MFERKISTGIATNRVEAGRDREERLSYRIYIYIYPGSISHSEVYNRVNAPLSVLIILFQSGTTFVKFKLNSSPSNSRELPLLHVKILHEQSLNCVQMGVYPVHFALYCTRVIVIKRVI